MMGDKPKQFKPQTPKREKSIKKVQQRDRSQRSVRDRSVRDMDKSERTESTSTDSDMDVSEFEEQEDPKDYKPGGYHPVTVYSVFNDRYCAIRKIGWGHFSTVWLSWDIKNKQFVALKLLKSADHYKEVAADEIKLLTCANKCDLNDSRRNRIVVLMETFKFTGVNGSHVVMVFEMLGCNMLKLIIRSEYHGIPYENVRTIIRQLLEALAYLHSKCYIIHTDVKPENVLLCKTGDEIKNLAVDVIAATKSNQLSHAQRGSFEYKNENVPQLSLHRSASPSPHSSLDHSRSESTDTSERDGSWMQKVFPQQLTDKNSSVSQRAQKLKPNSKKMSARSMAAKLEKGLKSLADRTPKYDVRLLEKDLNDGGLNQSTAKPAVAKKDPAKDVCDIEIKLADLGNSCWTHHHYSEDVQTRQYRAIEVILGIKYTTAIDVWSVACLAFELATGCYLFEPQERNGANKDEDHLCLISEIVGPIPRSLMVRGKFAMNFFNAGGEFRHSKVTKKTTIKNILMERHQWPENKAGEFHDFLMPLLNLDPAQRLTADQCLQLPWFVKPS